MLFSGGDSPGMNALMRAVTRLGLNEHKVPVIGVRNGYSGLVAAALETQGNAEALAKVKQSLQDKPGRAGFIGRKQHLVRMDHDVVSGIVRTGGILLGSARCLEFHKKEIRAEAIRLMKDLEAQALIVCGGDGSLTGARLLAEESDLPVVGVPGTIDNDLDFTDMALGVDTALNTLAWAVDHFKDTARSHRRIMILETMGRASGELARLAAIASGAEMVITPRENQPVTRAEMAKHAESIMAGMDEGRSHAIILIAEGVTFEPEVEAEHQLSEGEVRNRAYVLAHYLKHHFRQNEEYASLEVRPSVLGHLQRGGLASPQDSILAASFADAALKQALIARESGITALREGRVKIVSFGSANVPDRRQLKDSYTQLHRRLSAWRPVG
jgi:6-phosphofructokinase 1